jgi:hypothetical protein
LALPVSFFLIPNFIFGSVFGGQVTAIKLKENELELSPGDRSRLKDLLVSKSWGRQFATQL